MDGINVREMARGRRIGLVCASIACAALLLASATPARAQGVSPFAPRSDTEAGSSASPPPSTRTPPRLTHFVEAEYPAEARDQGIEGSVLLEISIDETGHVTDARVARPLGHGLDDAAVVAARQFVFDPATVDGHPVAARIRYRYRFTLHTAASAAPTGPVAVVTGTIRDVQNRPLADADVQLDRPNQPPLVARTDAMGTFRFELDRPGIVSLGVSASGFRPFHSEEELHARDELRVTYRLVALGSSAPPPAASGEQTVTVRTRAPPREVDRVTLDREEITRIPGTGGDALRSIQNLPGLARPPFFSGALIVRGSAPEDTQVFADGSGIPLLYHFGGLTSVIPNEMLDRIDFYPGNFSARYGRAMGGIVDVGLRSPRTEGYHGVAEIGLLDGHVFAEGAITSTLSVAIAARRSWIDAVLGAVLSQASGFTIVPVYYDYQAVLEWRPTIHNRFRLAFFGDDDSLTLVQNNPPSGSEQLLPGGLSLHTQFHIGQLSWIFEPAPGTRSTAMVSFGYTGLGVTAGGIGLGFQSNEYPLNFRYELSHRLTPWIRLDAGFDVIAIPGNADVTFPSDAGGPIGKVDISEFRFHPATYFEAELTPMPGLRIVPGVRVDWFSDINAGIVQPRLSARYEFGHGFSVRAGIGLFAQPPSAQQATPAADPFLPGHTVGNPMLLPQRAMHYALGVEEQFFALPGAAWLSHLSISLEGFYKVLDSLVVATPDYLQLAQPPAPTYENLGTGHVMGLEVLLRYRHDGRFFGWLAYTLSQATRSDGPGQPEHLFQYDQTHILTLIGSYRIGWGIETGLRLRYVTGSLITPIVGSFYDASTLSYTPIYGPAYSQRLPDYFEIDLRVDKTFRFHWGSIGLFLEIFNLTNNGNVEGYQYNNTYTEHAPINGLPIFPNLGIRGEI